MEKIPLSKDKGKDEFLCNEWKLLVEKMTVEEIENQLEINQNIVKQTNSFTPTPENQETIDTIIKVSNAKIQYLTEKLEKDTLFNTHIYP